VRREAVGYEEGRGEKEKGVAPADYRLTGKFEEESQNG
jgi:hypothetical protein